MNVDSLYFRMMHVKDGVVKTGEKESEGKDMADKLEKRVASRNCLLFLLSDSGTENKK